MLSSSDYTFALGLILILIIKLNVMKVYLRKNINSETFYKSYTCKFFFGILRKRYFNNAGRCLLRIVNVFDKTAPSSHINKII